MIPPVSGVTDALAPSLLGPLTGMAAPAVTGATGAGGDFGATIAGAIDNLQQLQSTSNALAVQAVTGDLDDIHDYTIASAQSSMAFELTAAIRNKAVDAFTEIMRMQA